MPVDVGLWGAGALLGVTGLALAAGRLKAGSALVYGASLLVCAAALGSALGALIGGAGESERVLPLGLPWLGAQFRIDALAAFFLIVVNLGGAATSLYALGYGRHEAAPMRVLPFFPAFLAAMNLVVLADDAFTFLFAWEFMSLTSWALVMAHHRERDNARAGYVYFLMASFGTLALLLAFGALAGQEGDYAFAVLRASSGHHTAAVAALVLVFALLGAGSKARLVFDLLGEPSWWSSMTVLALGGATAVLGVLYALMEHDLKRLLAYHTVENIGIIFIGLGLALAFRANGVAWAAALALTAALFHVLNHSLFKSLLFFGAGAVLNATGERDMEHLGGLIHRMKATSVLFLVGCVAISALPPLNGFVSEWLTFQAILVSPDLPQWGLKILIPGIGALLALAAALAAACFVKAFGVTFLGRPRSEAARNAKEVDRFSIAAMALLAILCLVAGVVPGLVVDGLSPVVASLVQARMPSQEAMPWLSLIPIAASRSSY